MGWETNSMKPPRKALESIVREIAAEELARLFASGGVRVDVGEVTGAMGRFEIPVTVRAGDVAAANLRLLLAEAEQNIEDRHQGLRIVLLPEVAGPVKRAPRAKSSRSKTAPGRAAGLQRRKR